MDSADSNSSVIDASSRKASPVSAFIQLDYTSTGYRLHQPDNIVYITIDDDGVSRKHGELSFDNGTLWLQDSGSRNGIYVNGNRIVGHKALKVNDEILIGAHVLRVAWQDSTLDDLDQESPTKKRRWFWPF